MEMFISCDWGTSALRLKIFDVEKKTVLAEADNMQGIAATYKHWKDESNRANERVAFYQSILKEQIQILEKQNNYLFQDVPLVISGMASSNIGMAELPYKELPLSIDGHDLNIKIFEKNDEFKHNVLLVSGAKTTDDAMRGEETQLIGCLDNDDQEVHLFLFPGTHSKHVWVKKGQAVDIKTYMTGEFFELLSQKSILSNDVENTLELINENDLKIFERGVADSLHSNILHGAFRVRTNHLFDIISKQQNYWYLSGLLTGTELKDLAGTTVPITVVGDELRIKLYSSALQIIGVPGSKSLNAGKVVLKGHSKLYNLYKSKLNKGRTLIK